MSNNEENYDVPSTDDKFGKRLKELRMQNNMTQKELANIFNVSQNAIFNWENGKREPSIVTIKKLADFFKVPLIDLLGYMEVKSFNTGEEFEKERSRLIQELNTNDSESITIVYSVSPESQLLESFRLLNEEGQKKIISYTKDLTELTKYTKDEEE